jgi:hypothetical protein
MPNATNASCELHAAQRSSHLGPLHTSSFRDPQAWVVIPLPSCALTPVVGEARYLSGCSQRLMWGTRIVRCHLQRFCPTPHEIPVDFLASSCLHCMLFANRCS